ncbi:hypothetical protein [Phormidium tenue]|jgi:hypothetical protein|uniref:Uncharacterized protein n=1 Tax=Phormidium tenue FACHB-1050 TaxID=2692857 RepID=A0ABR8C5E0_9CYAN|nr:hypothetical protein [Phormidium tenue]MBD2315979.1 hypothetical protein [Phormidium tenue FACHB-1050]
MKDINSLLNEYSIFTTPEKFHFFGCNAHEILGSFEEREIYNFLRSIILNEKENTNIRKKAIELHTEYILISKLKPRYALDILISSWEKTQDVFLEVRRLKDLFLFYELEQSDIKKIYQLGTHNDEVEIQAESYFYLGLIYFLSALKSEKSEFKKMLQDSLSAFDSAFEIIENRIDAEFFKAIINFILDLMEGRKESSNYHLSRLTDILWRRDILSISNVNSPFWVSFYKVLLSISKVEELLQPSWLDYRENFSKLHYYYCEIKNDELKDRLSESLLKEEFSKYCIASFFDPYILISPNYELAKIDVRLKEVSVNSEEYKFLNYLKELGSNSDSKKKIGIEELTNKFLQLFPDRDLSLIEPLLSQISNQSDVNKLFQAFNILKEPSTELFLDSCLHSCIELQSNKIYSKASEDERNTFIASILNTKDWVVKDQTRRGLSYQGKSAGELDMFITLQNGRPFAVVEALNLDSLDKKYIDLHLEKIFRYDTLGLKQNMILIYSSAQKFNELWKKYCGYIKEVNYPYDLIQSNKLDSYNIFPEIRLTETIHLREGMEVSLFHIMVNMNVLIRD